MKIAFTGPRNLSSLEEDFCLDMLCFVPSYLQGQWLVGDAPGLDELVRCVAPRLARKLRVFEVQGKERWQYAVRSKRMIDSLSPATGHLIAFPNKPCPESCRPSANPVAAGSGTWLTIAYAKYREIPITIWGFDYREYPDWLKRSQRVSQLSLF